MLLNVDNSVILGFWAGSFWGPPPHKLPKIGRFLNLPYKAFIRAGTTSILEVFHFLAFWHCGPSFPCILALWAFISLHFGLVGLHFLAFWPCGPSFPCILAFSGSASGVAKNGPFAQRPYNGFISAVTGSILQFLAFCAFISLHFGLVGLHFLAFWPCGPSFPCILALWAFISLHFGLVGLHFLAFWPCGPSLPCILALWAFISLHFGFVGLHFLAFWPSGPSFPCILALWAFMSLHFGLVGLHFLSFWPFRGQLLGPPPTSCQKWAVFLISHTNHLSKPGPRPFWKF